MSRAGRLSAMLAATALTALAACADSPTAPQRPEIRPQFNNSGPCDEYTRIDPGYECRGGWIIPH